MNPVPTNRLLFWACFLGGTLGPISRTFLISLGRRLHDDWSFLLSWTLWFSGVVLLTASYDPSGRFCWTGLRIVGGLFVSTARLSGSRLSNCGIHSPSRHLSFQLSGQRLPGTGQWSGFRISCRLNVSHAATLVRLSVSFAVGRICVVARWVRLIAEWQPEFSRNLRPEFAEDIKSHILDDTVAYRLRRRCKSPFVSRVIGVA